jgi:hypothetical protein
MSKFSRSDFLADVPSTLDVLILFVEVGWHLDIGAIDLFSTDDLLVQRRV